MSIIKVYEIVNLIKKERLEDFDFEFMFEDGYNVFPNNRLFKISGIADVGHSDNIVLLEGLEKE